MTIQFHCLHNARIYYRVVLGGRSVFCGTRGECRRFIVLHNEKALRSALESITRGRAGTRRARRREAASLREVGVELAT